MWIGKHGRLPTGISARHAEGGKYPVSSTQYPARVRLGLTGYWLPATGNPDPADFYYPVGLVSVMLSRRSQTK